MDQKWKIPVVNNFKILLSHFCEPVYTFIDRFKFAGGVNNSAGYHEKTTAR